MVFRRVLFRSSHSERYCWLTARLNKVLFPHLDERGSPTQGVIARILIYSSLKHVHHAISTEDFSSKIETKTRGRTRLERFEALVQQLEELVEKDGANKAVLLSQVLRIEIKLMGHSLTDMSQWIITNPNRQIGRAHV